MECSCEYAIMQMVATRPLNSRFLRKFSSVVTGDGLSAQWQIFGDASYDWSVMSSITGPSFGSDLLRMTLPMEVVTVSTYTNPVVSSLIMQLELMHLKWLAVVTNPMDIGPTSASTSLLPQLQVSSDMLLHLAKPWGRVGSHLNANALAGGGDGSGNRAFNMPEWQVYRDQFE